MNKKELITKFLNRYKTKISSITFFINSIYQQNIFLYKIILQAGAPSWRNGYQVVSQLNPWIGNFFPVKAEMLYFSKMRKGDQKGDHLELYFALKEQFVFEIFKKFFKFQTNTDLQVVPLLVHRSNF